MVESGIGDRVPTGCASIDRLIGGGFPRGLLSLVYGEAETGKTCLAMQCAVECARKGLKTLYVDADGTLSVTRLSQVAGVDLDRVSPLIIVFTPEDFQNLILLVERLERYVAGNTVLAVVDTVTSLYRVELAQGDEVFTLNRELNRMLAYLCQLAKTRGLALLLTSQVRSVIDSTPSSYVGEIEPVANRVLTYWSSLILRLKPTARSSVKECVLEHGISKEKADKRCFYSLSDKGVESVLGA